ncbi:TipAS antibiotic-recognition domain-containing protein [Nocardia sp. NPDC052001]|uniref:TipAS antibiotic-recognition domain-containing protein n=1 Tax=Nocardia sp. NPDC052001 TaxID=3154853 RepID=UPI00342DA2D2
MRAGPPADEPTVMDPAERHRRHFERWFHACDFDTDRTFAEEYRANRRLGLNYDHMAPGYRSTSTTQFWRTANGIAPFRRPESRSTRNI